MSEQIEAAETEAEGAEAAPVELHPMLGVPGLHAGIPEEQYHAGPGISQSKLKLFLDAPAKARFGENKQSEALTIGSAVHRIMLEPGRFETEYVVFKHNGSTKLGKAERAEAKERKLIGITQATADLALGCAKSLREHPIARALLDGLDPAADMEQTAYTVCPKTGLLLRARFDVTNRRHAFIGDIKTAFDAAPREFGRAAANLRYDLQAAYYSRIGAAVGLDVEHFVFVVVEKEKPYLTACYVVDQDDLSRASDEIDEVLERWAECERTDNWPGYPGHLMTLQLPAWLRAA